MGDGGELRHVFRFLAAGDSGTWTDAWELGLDVSQPALRGASYGRVSGWPFARAVTALPYFDPEQRLHACSMRQVARVPGLAESRGAQIPVGADLARHGSQVVPEVGDRGHGPRTNSRCRCGG